MKLEDILTQLKKEKDPLKYLKSLLKEIKDEKLKKEIEKLLKTYEEKSSKPQSQSLESAVQSTSIRLPRVETETFETYSPSRRRERISTSFPGQSQENNVKSESYGSSVKTDYMRNEFEVRQNLETSGLITRSSFNTTSEAKEAIRQKGSIPGKDYNIAEREERIQYSHGMDSFMQEDASGPFDLRESHKKRKNSGVYHAWKI